MTDSAEPDKRNWTFSGEKGGAITRYSAGLTWSALSFSSITLVWREAQIDAQWQHGGEAMNRRERVVVGFKQACVRRVWRLWPSLLIFPRLFLS